MLDGIIGILVGLLLLFAGRRFFWLAAGLIAFLFGWHLFGNLIGWTWVGILVGLAAGVIFGWLAVKFVKIAAYFIAFFAGAVGLPILFSFFGLSWSWLFTALVGGVIGLLLVIFAFDWGLILITAWAGASSVSNGVIGWLNPGNLVAGLIFVALFLLGAGYQSTQLKQKKT